MGKRERILNMTKTKYDIMFLVVCIIVVCIGGCLLTACGHKKAELCPSDTHLTSYPKPGHGPNPFRQNTK